MQSCGHWTTDGFVPYDCRPRTARSNQRNSGSGALASAVSGGLALRCRPCHLHPGLHDRGRPVGSIHFEVHTAAVRKFRKGRARGRSHVVVRSFRDNDGFPHGRRNRSPIYPPTRQPNHHSIGRRHTCVRVHGIRSSGHSRAGFRLVGTVGLCLGIGDSPDADLGVSLLEWPCYQRSSWVKTACEPVLSPRLIRASEGKPSACSLIAAIVHAGSIRRARFRPSSTMTSYHPYG